MSAQHFVVDGSNIATEGRTTPSLAQLQDAVRAFREDYPEGSMTVVVDASFAHRIDESERTAFERAEAWGELVSPPAGAIGRGDGFLLQIADRTNATVLSNDSFQEFHGEYPWLFDVSRLVGGKPVPGVGWIFSLRTPVRGAKSRQATRVKAKPLKDAAAEAKPPARPPKKVTAAIAAATVEALSPAKRRPRRRKGPSPEAVNEPATFLQFLIDHRLGSEVEGTVEEFASHGAFVAADGVRAYLPLAAMGDPPPTRARDVLDKGERRAFIVQAVDAPRRAIEVGLPGFAHLTGAPSEEMVEAVTKPRAKKRTARKEKPPEKAEKAAKGEKAEKAAKGTRRSTRRRAAPAPEAADATAGDATPAPVAAPAARKRTKKAVVKADAGEKAAAAKKAGKKAADGTAAKKRTAKKAGKKAGDAQKAVPAKEQDKEQARMAAPAKKRSPKKAAKQGSADKA